jgi:hypothetical protein
MSLKFHRFLVYIKESTFSTPNSLKSQLVVAYVQVACSTLIWEGREEAFNFLLSFLSFFSFNLTQYSDQLSGHLSVEVMVELSIQFGGIY